MVPKAREVSKTVVLAFDTKLTQSFEKFLYIAVLVLMKNGEVDKNLLVSATPWYKAARDWLTEAGLNTDLADQIRAFIKAADFDDLTLVAAAKELRRAKAVGSDTTLDHTDLDIIRAATTWIINRSQGAYRKLESLVPTLNEPAIAAEMVKETGSQRTFTSPLEKIVQAVGKRKDSALTVDEAKKLKAKSPDLYKEYLRLRKGYNQVWKDALKNFVFESRQPTVPYDSAVAYLKSLGMKFTLPQGFEGQIDGNGKLYTTKGLLINGVPGLGLNVRMNPDYDPTADNSYVFTAIDDLGKRRGHFYTTRYKRQATKEKFEVVEDLSKSVNAIRAKWLPLVRKGTLAPQCVASTILELIYQFSARIGNLGNSARGESTYGMSTLLVKHVLPQNDGSHVLRYMGKDGVKQIHRITNASAEGKWLNRNIAEELQGKSPKDRLWTYEMNGRTYPMTGNLVNRFFQKLGSPVTVHKLRHVKGTEIFESLVKANEDKLFNRKTPLTQAQADAAFKKFATAVGQQLGHVRGIGAQQKVTPATAIQSYISPSVMVDFYTRLDLRPPRFLQRFTGDA